MAVSTGKDLKPHYKDQAYYYGTIKHFQNTHDNYICSLM